MFLFFTFILLVVVLFRSQIITSISLESPFRISLKNKYFASKIFLDRQKLAANRRLENTRINSTLVWTARTLKLHFKFLSRRRDSSASFCFPV
jgi:hypothetical protein